MRHIIVFLVLASAALAQGLPFRIAPDEAEQHILKRAVAVYPSLAHTAGIQSNVILEVSVEESGTASVRRLVTGHPMLAPAAVEAVNKWKYRPFERHGKAAPVLTFVMVTFGQPTNHEAEDQVELRFQHDFWTAADSAQTALQAQDQSSTEQQLKKAADLLASTHRPHNTERAQLMTIKGKLQAAQGKYDEAEQSYKTALAASQVFDKNSLGVAISFANLGDVSILQGRQDIARDHIAHSLRVYETLFGNAPKDSNARRVYGRGAALQSWALLKLAMNRQDSADAAKQCREILKFQEYLNPTERQLVGNCEKSE